MNRYKPSSNPLEPPELADLEIYALKALRDGKASEGQQKMALATIVIKFSAVDDWAYRPDQDRSLTDIMLGRQYVAHRIREALTRPLKPQKTGDDNARTSSSPATSGGSPSTRRNPKPKSPAKP